MIELELMKYWQPTGANREKIIQSALTGDNYFLMPKIDGAFYRFVKDEQSNTMLISRTESVSGKPVDKAANVPHIIKALEALPPGTSLLGEIAYYNSNSAETTSIMGCLPPKAIARQKEKGWIHYFPFDILSHSGVNTLDMAAIDRQVLLDKVLLTVSKEYIHRIPYFTKNLEQVLAGLLAEGAEGCMLYKKTDPYYPGLRKAHTTIKVKKSINEVDAICLGFEPPTKNYAGSELDSWQYWENGEPVTRLYAMGWCGALRVGVYKQNKLVDLGTVSSGLTDLLRADIKQNASAYIGKPVLLKAMEVTDEALRHPVFINFRDDIDAKDCTWDKIFQNV